MASPRPRYGVYYAPPLDGGLWQAGCAWLGRDPVSGDALPQPSIPGLATVDIEAITAGPRHYGFHATMKAPFELAKGQDEPALLDAALAFAAQQRPFEVPLSVQSLGQFIALRSAEPSAALTALHEACVKSFEPFRAPLSEADIARRRRANLSPEQDARMLTWGYPYIFDDFRWHMTLTGRIPDNDLRARVVEGLKAYFAPELLTPHRFDAIAIYTQPGRDAPFVLIERFEFPAPAKA